jgi:hypothetical protein
MLVLFFLKVSQEEEEALKVESCVGGKKSKKFNQ